MRIEVVRVQADGLRRDLWEFTSFMEHHAGLHLTLDRWEPQSRQSARHKWAKSGPGYRRRSHNGVIHFGGYLTPAAEVPLPEDVVDEAKTAVFNSLQVTGPVDPVIAKRA